MDSVETWQVDVNGQIFDTTLTELTEWIADGSVTANDKVRRGNLRWLQAAKSPALRNCFIAEEINIPAPGSLPVPRETKSANPARPPGSLLKVFSHAPSPDSERSTDTVTISRAESQCCAIHEDRGPTFICEGCANSFCDECVTRYGSGVRTCQLCGAMCVRSGDRAAQQSLNDRLEHDMAGGFGFGDFGKALAYPFKYPFSLGAGSVMFMVFNVGESAGSMGSIFLVVAAIFCLMLGNMLTFGVLANTVENMARGDVNLNFMPSFDDFNLWDDVVHPFCLSLGAYLSSFGLLAVVIAGGIWFSSQAPSSTANDLAGGTTGVPFSPLGPRDEIAKQLRAVEQTKKDQLAEFDAPADNATRPEISRSATPVRAGDEKVGNLEKLIRDQQKGELESVVGKTSETRNRETQALVERFTGAGTPMLLLAAAALLWGLFYFPAASAVAAYTRSFPASVNPSVGIDTIKRLGTDYLKILVFSSMLAGAFYLVSLFFGGIFSSFDLPGLGNVPARAVGSIFGFYLIVVFSVMIGFAVYKNGQKLGVSAV
jgi:hypothetical protein